MGLRSFLLPTVLSIGLTHAAFNWRADSCSDEKKDIIREELLWARELAIRTTTYMTNGPYYETFFSQGVRDRPNWLLTSNRIFTQISIQLDENNDEYTFEIICDNSTPTCQDEGFFASMNPSTDVMNFCDRYFDTKAGLAPYQTTRDNCANVNLRDVHRTRTTVIVHELTHSDFAMSPEPRTRDFAYGFNGCYLLPRGTFDRSCTPYAGKPRVECPRGDDATKEGVCPADYSATNADSWAFIAAGCGWSSICGREIPFPPNLPARKLRRSRNPRIGLQQKRQECFEDDSLPFDNGPLE